MIGVSRSVLLSEMHASVHLAPAFFAVDFLLRAVASSGFFSRNYLLFSENTPTSRIESACKTEIISI